eukprot:GHRQ01023807.1.p2 GENE.GHRQ01023807.1~~GHRQ01023807.1.p2  ORF type:complete len:121 (-),score=5.61 GHRQ01023807.1:55-417(-)
MQLVLQLQHSCCCCDGAVSLALKPRFRQYAGLTSCLRHVDQVCHLGAAAAPWPLSLCCSHVSSCTAAEARYVKCNAFAVSGALSNHVLKIAWTMCILETRVRSCTTCHVATGVGCNSSSL